MEVISFLWTEVVTRPMTNGLVLFYSVLAGNFGLAIIAFTVVIRIFMYPLTMKQLKATRSMQQLQPRMKDLQERYKNDKQRLQREQMKMFKEAGVNPIGCLGPILIQFPIWIGLFYAIRDTVADTPERLIGLSNSLYSWLPMVDGAVPLNGRFLWMDLGLPDPSPIIMPLLVGGSMWVVQKMAATPSLDPRQQSTTSMMNWMMPVMFGFWTLAFPSGLAVYWVASNLISIALQYRVTGWGGLRKEARAPVPAAVGETTIEGQKVPAARHQSSDTPVRSAPTGPASGGLGGILKRIFLGTPPTPDASSSANAEGAQPQLEAGEEPASDGDGAAPAPEREHDATSRKDRQDSRRSYRQSSGGARGRTGRHRSRRRR